MAYYIPMVIMLILAVISGPPEKDEFNVEIYNNQKLIQTLIVKRTEEGFAGYNEKEEVFTITPAKDRKNVYDWFEKDGGLEIDLARYIDRFDLRKIIGVKKADLKLGKGLFIHIWQEPGQKYFKLDPMKIEKTDQQQEVMYIVR
jgi:hypothetical protein